MKEYFDYISGRTPYYGARRNDPYAQYKNVPVQDVEESAQQDGKGQNPFLSGFNKVLNSFGQQASSALDKMYLSSLVSKFGPQILDGDRNTANIRDFEYYASLSPEGRRLYDMSRRGDTWRDVGDSVVNLSALNALGELPMQASRAAIDDNSALNRFAEMAAPPSARPVNLYSPSTGRVVKGLPPEKLPQVIGDQERARSENQLINTGDAYVRPGDMTKIPINVSPDQNPSLKQSQAMATEVGRGQGEAEAKKQDRARFADRVFPVLENTIPVLLDATNGRLEGLYRDAKGAFGVATKGSVADRQLKIIAAELKLAAEKDPGNPTDTEQKERREATSAIDDSNAPVQDRMAALLSFSYSTLRNNPTERNLQIYNDFYQTYSNLFGADNPTTKAFSPEKFAKQYLGESKSSPAKPAADDASATDNAANSQKKLTPQEAAREFLKTRPVGSPEFEKLPADMKQKIINLSR